MGNVLDYTKLTLDTQFVVYKKDLNPKRPPKVEYFGLYTKKPGSKNIDNYTLRRFVSDNKVECINGKFIIGIFLRFGIGRYSKIEFTKIGDYMFQRLNEALKEEDKLECCPKGVHITFLKDSGNVLKFNLQEDQENGKQK